MPIVEMNKDTEDIVYAGSNLNVEQIVKENTLDLTFRRIGSYEETFEYLKNRMGVFSMMIRSGLGIGRTDVERAVYPSLILIDACLPEGNGSNKTVEQGGGLVRFLDEDLISVQSYVFTTEGFDSREYETKQYCEEYNVPTINESELIPKLAEIYPVAK